MAELVAAGEVLVAADGGGAAVRLIVTFAELDASIDTDGGRVATGAAGGGM